MEHNLPFHCVGLGGLLWLFQWIDRAKNKVTRLKARSFKRQCSVYFCCWNTHSGNPELPRGHHAVRKPKLARRGRPDRWALRLDRERWKREEKGRGGYQEKESCVWPVLRCCRPSLFQLWSSSDWSHMRNPEPKLLIQMLTKFLTH